MRAGMGARHQPILQRRSPQNERITLEAAKEKFHNGFKFRISAIELNIKSKPEYTSTTVKHTVDLFKTTMSKLLARFIAIHSLW